MDAENDTLHMAANRLHQAICAAIDSAAPKWKGSPNKAKSLEAVKEFLEAFARSREAQVLREAAEELRRARWGPVTREEICDWLDRRSDEGTKVCQKP